MPSDNFTEFHVDITTLKDLRITRRLIYVYFSVACQKVDQTIELTLKPWFHVTDVPKGIVSRQ